MHSSDSGVWTLFVPGLEEYAVYKYRIDAKSGKSFDKADPYGFQQEHPPATASVVHGLPQRPEIGLLLQRDGSAVVGGQQAGDRRRSGMGGNR